MLCSSSPLLPLVAWARSHRPPLPQLSDVEALHAQALLVGGDERRAVGVLLACCLFRFVFFGRALVALLVLLLCGCRRFGQVELQNNGALLGRSQLTPPHTPASSAAAAASLTALRDALVAEPLRAFGGRSRGRSGVRLRVVRLRRRRQRAPRTRGSGASSSTAPSPPNRQQPVHDRSA